MADDALGRRGAQLMALWVVGVVIAGVALVRGRPSRSPDFVPAPERETEELARAVSERPTTLDGRKRTDGMPWSTWLGWVAYRRAYPLGPKEPRVAREPHYSEALARLRAAAAQHLSTFVADPEAEARECIRFSWTPWAKSLDVPKGHHHLEYTMGLSEKYGGEGGKVRALLYDGAFQLPFVWEGRSEKTSGLKREEWFGWVAYRKAYPDGPPSPEPGTAWDAALERMRACVEGRFLEGRGGG